MGKPKQKLYFFKKGSFHNCDKHKSLMDLLTVNEASINIIMEQEYSKRVVPITEEYFQLLINDLNLDSKTIVIPIYLDSAEKGRPHFTIKKSNAVTTVVEEVIEAKQAELEG